MVVERRERPPTGRDHPIGKKSLQIKSLSIRSDDQDRVQVMAFAPGQAPEIKMLPVWVDAMRL